MSDGAFSSAINPYALTEALVGRRINWSRISDPIELVSRTLETPREDLFDGGKGSPTLAIYDAMQAQGGEFVRQAEVQEGGLPHVNVTRLNLRSGIKTDVVRKIEAMVLPTYNFGETDYPGATWLDVGNFFHEGTEFADPVQGPLGDCWLIAALASVAWTRPYAVVQRNRTVGPGDQEFVDAIDLEYTANNVRTYQISEKLPVWNGTSMLVYGRSVEVGEIWPGMYEKAFAKLRTGNLTDKPDFASLNGGDCVDASARLVPGLTAHYTDTAPTSANNLWKLLTNNSLSNPNNGNVLLVSRAGRTINPMTAWTYGQAKDAPDKIDYDWTTGIVANHCYSVLGWISTSPVLALGGRSSRYIVLRNPWGMHEGQVDSLPGSWTAYDQSWYRSTPLNSRGVFAMTIEAFKKYFAGIGVAS